MTETMLRMRPARAADAQTIFEFCNRLWNGDSDYISEVWEEWLAEGNLFAGTLPGADVPCAVVRVRMLSADEAWFGGLRLHPDLHGRGIGRQLIQFAETWAMERGARTIGYMTGTTNTTMLHLASRLGFTWLGIGDWHRLKPQATDLPAPQPAPDCERIDLQHAPHLKAQSGFYSPGWVIQRLTPERLALHTTQSELFTGSATNAWLILMGANDPEEAALLAHAEGEPAALRDLLAQALATPAAQAHGLVSLPFQTSPLARLCQTFGFHSTGDLYALFEKELP